MKVIVCHGVIDSESSNQLSGFFFFLNMLFVATFHSGPSEESINVTILVLWPVNKVLVQVSHTSASQDSHI